MSDTEQFHQWVGLRFQKSFFLQLFFFSFLFAMEIMVEIVGSHEVEPYVPKGLPCINPMTSITIIINKYLLL